VRTRIIDTDDGFSEYTSAVTVANVAPTATFSNSEVVSLVSATSASGDSAPLRRHEQAALDREGRALGPDRDDERSRARTDAAEGPVGRCCAPRCRPALRLSRRGLGTMGEAVALLPSTVRANRGATAEREWPIVADRHDFAVLDLSR
jgi:hypothetical protein